MGFLSMVKIKKQLSNNKNHYGTGNTKQSITIHETGNSGYGANAQAHANLIDNGFTNTWHYTVDEKQAIQSFSHDVRCWHGGDGRKATGGNYTSIAIEICVNRDGNYLKAIQNAIELVQVIMKQENIPASRVYQHNHWNGKNCPQGIRSESKGITWKQFKNALATPTIEFNTSSIHDLAIRTINGEFGNGETRKKMLGKDYSKVQNEVNNILSGKTKTVDINDLVNRTMKGEFGNGEERKRKLGKYYSQVQREVNKRFK